MNLSNLRYTPAVSLVALAALFSNPAHGQQAGTGALPDAPSFALGLMASGEATVTDPAVASYSTSALGEAAQTSPQSSTTNQKISAGNDPEAKQTKRIFGIIPNYQSVSINQKLPPQTVKEKFTIAVKDSFDYSSVVGPAFAAAIGQANDSVPEFHQGGAGYGRYFWHYYVDQADKNLWVKFIIPSVAHEDTRYYTLGEGGFKKRTIYAVKHAVVTRNDSGGNVFNAGEVVGSGVAAGLENLYYPASQRTAGKTFEHYGTSVGGDALGFVLREFWPDINHKLFGGPAAATK